MDRDDLAFGVNGKTALGRAIDEREVVYISDVGSELYMTGYT